MICRAIVGGPPAVMQLQMMRVKFAHADAKRAIPHVLERASWDASYSAKA